MANDVAMPRVRQYCSTAAVKGGECGQSAINLSVSHQAQGFPETVHAMTHPRAPPTSSPGNTA